VRRIIIALLAAFLAVAVAVAPAPARKQEEKKKNDPTVDVNGCGPEWLKDTVPDYPGGFDFHEICNEHDRCYQTKGKKKDDCDKEFYDAMKKKCGEYKGPKYVIYGWKFKAKPKPHFERYDLKEVDFTKETQTHCLGWAKLYYEAVKKLGKKSFEEGQKVAKDPEKPKEPEKKEPPKEQPPPAPPGDAAPAPGEPGPAPSDPAPTQTAPAPPPEPAPTPTPTETTTTVTTAG
jgi:hypothetical protein